jgi:pimeloyl-ACP methyl ester carboxylesterase
MMYVETPDAVPLYYEEHGEGETILLVHGWMCNAEYWWQKNVPALAESYHVVALDLRGHGLSGKTDDGHTLAQYARDVRHLVESLDLTDVTFVGWSMGTHVALSYFEQFGDEDVRAFGFVDMSPYWYSGEGWEYPLFGEFPRAGVAEFVEALRTDRSGVLKAQGLPAYFVEQPPEETVDEMYAEMMKTPTSTAVTMFEEMVAADFRETVGAVDVPTLLLYGGQSAIFPGPLGEWMHERMPDSELVIFEKSSHCPFWEEPETFDRELGEFVSEVAGRDVGIAGPS